MPKLVAITLLVALASPLLAGEVNTTPNPGTVAAKVDLAINRELSTAGMKITGPATDEDFLRRVSLDLTGQLPSPSRVTLFTLDPKATKRDALVDTLLQSDRFNETWARYFRDVIFSRVTEQRARIGIQVFNDWMTERLSEGATWDEIATDLITATGDVREDGSTAVLLAQGAEAEEVAAEVSRLFLGVQIQCANCHDHTTDRWKREDFHQLAAFFPRIRLRPINTSDRRTFEITAVNRSARRQGSREQITRFLFARFDRNRDSKLSEEELKESPAARNIIRIFQLGDANKDGFLTKEELASLPEAMSQRNDDIEHFMPNLDDPAVKGEQMEPTFFLSGEEIRSGLDDDERRAELARLITDRNNPWFSKAFVNRIWGELIGEGFVMPIDDLGPDREELYPEAFAVLSDGFTKSGYDIRWLFATIMRTDAYRRAAAARQPGDLPFASAMPTRLRADQIFDSLSDVLNVEFDNIGRRSVRGAYPNRFSPRIRFAAEFGFDPSTPQEDITGTVPQALVMMNSTLLSGQIKATGQTRLAGLLREFEDDADAIPELYLMVLAREPSEKEIAICTEYIKDVDNRNEAFEDLLWSLLNSSEFLTKR